MSAVRTLRALILALLALGLVAATARANGPVRAVDSVSITVSDMAVGVADEVDAHFDVLIAYDAHLFVV
jgi:hypothetical protein